MPFWSRRYARKAALKNKGQPRSGETEMFFMPQEGHLEKPLGLGQIGKIASH